MMMTMIMMKMMTMTTQTDDNDNDNDDDDVDVDDGADGYDDNPMMTKMMMTVSTTMRKMMKTR